MTRLRARDQLPAFAFAALGVWLMSFLTLYGFGWNDYSSEAAPAYDALTAGHLWRFLTLVPSYGGSLELRAPFALIPGLWGGGELAVYQAVSIACLVAAGLLGLWLCSRMAALGHGTLARATTLGLCVANPVTLYALQDGHAEELLGAVLCVSAVLAAQRGRAGWSGVLLGLAIVNKQWALVAIGPVLLALPTHRWRAAAFAALVAGCFYVPLWLPAYVIHGSTGSSGGALAAASAGSIFQPWQLWWFLGSHGHLVVGAFGSVKLGYRTPPGWLASIDHPMIVAAALALSVLAARLRRATDAMLLLALALAVRFAFDTWDTVYYALPFVVALLAWESLARRRPPILALAASVAVWLIFIVAPAHLSPDAQAALFLAAAAPTLAVLALAVFAPRSRPRHTVRGAADRRSSSPAASPISTV